VSCERLISDFEDIDSNLHEIKIRAETDIAYFVARLSAKEVQRAQQQARNMSFLNALVFVLGPLSTLAAILAVEDRQKYDTLFIVTLVIGLVGLMLSNVIGRIRRAVFILQTHLHRKLKGDKEDPFDFLASHNN
jgi:hypothetical protein